MNDWGRAIAAVIARRSELGLTQRDLAAKAAVAERTVQNLEAGKRPQPLIRAKIEKALGWESGEMERIASRESEPEPPPIPAEVLAVIRKSYPPDKQAEAILMLQQLNGPTGQLAKARPESRDDDERAG